MYRFTHLHTPFLDSPPPCVQAEVDAAWERAQDLIAGELELHFSLESVTRALSCELRSVDGSVCERVSATEALALACGDVALALTA